MLHTTFFAFRDAHINDILVIKRTRTQIVDEAILSSNPHFSPNKEKEKEREKGDHENEAHNEMIELSPANWEVNLAEYPVIR